LFSFKCKCIVIFFNRPATAVAAGTVESVGNEPFVPILVVQALWATALQEFAVVHMAALSTSAITSIHKTNPKLQAFT
jgi:hypothetical protein